MPQHQPYTRTCIICHKRKLARFMRRNKGCGGFRGGYICTQCWYCKRFAYATLEIIKHLELVQTLIWSKGKTDGSFVGLGWRYRPSYETILVSAKDAETYNFYPQYSSNVFVCKPHIPQQGEHPTQKPLKLMRWLIENHTKKGDTVLDPFMGSGTTGVACQQLNRNFIGYEISPDYFKIAEKRINEAKAQKKLGSYDDYQNEEE